MENIIFRVLNLELLSMIRYESGGDRMSGKSNFNSYDNDRKYDTDRARWRVWSRGYSTHDFYAAIPSGNILADVVKNGTICGVRL